MQALSPLTAENRPPTVKQLAEMTGLTTGSATRLVDRLERGGYVTRTPDQHDPRRVLVTPIPEHVARITAVWDDLGQSRRTPCLRPQPLTDGPPAVTTETELSLGSGADMDR